MLNSCPVNFIKIDENQLRIQSFFVTLVSISIILTGVIDLAALLVYDYFARIFLSQKFSPFAQIALFIIRIFKIKQRLVDSAPKNFASKIGLIFSIAIFSSFILGSQEAVFSFAVILAVSAGLESFLNFCVGCKFYAILKYFKIF
ncbi:MAG: DUF4395 domain-containing protein [Sulfurimonas sp.]|nr:DUF4395 domain-containing protein [Sulfurimonas sp.]